MKPDGWLHAAVAPARSMKDFNTTTTTTTASTHVNTTDTNDEGKKKILGLNGQKAALQLICLGSGGGPGEDNTAGFLVRSVGREWARGSLLAVDAGSHLAPIAKILERDFPAVSEGRELSGWASKRGSGSGENETGGQGEVVAGGQTPGLSGRFARASLSPESGDTVEDVEDVEVDADTLSPSASPSPAPEPTVLTEGPFAGLKFPNASARANAAHVVRAYVSTYLITHPHLDHLAGFAINTAALNGGTRPKTLAALPSTVEAVKQHIFNDIIWPNLTDEDGGVGFVTFQRLKEGGDPMIGEGEGRGYIDVCDGLGVRAFKVSHGTCTKSPPSHHHRGSRGSISGATTADPQNNSSMSESARQVSMSMSQQQHTSFSTPGTPGGPLNRQSTSQLQQPQQATLQPGPPPAPATTIDPTTGSNCVVDSTAFFIRDCDTAREVLVFGDVEPDSISLSPRNAIVWAEAARKIAHNLLGGIFIECSYDDSQADSLLFGHLCPRHLYAELRTLAAMVVEARAIRAWERGHKKRKRSAAPLPNGLEGAVAAHAGGKRSRSLASRSLESRLRGGSGSGSGSAGRRSSGGGVGGGGGGDYNMPDASATPGSMTTTPSTTMSTRQPSPDALNAANVPASPKTVLRPQQGFPTSSTAGRQGTTSQPQGQQAQQAPQQQAPQQTQAHPTPRAPLEGLKVIVIHIKDTLKDGPHVSQNILRELREHEDLAWREGGGEDGEGDGTGVTGGLGCEFGIAGRGGVYWF